MKVKTYKLLLMVSLIIFLFLILRGILFFTAKPNISVNYVAELNRISKPANYDPNQNAYLDYAKLFSFIELMPEEMHSQGSYKWPEWPGDFNESQLVFLKNWLENNSSQMERLKTGSEKPYYWFEAPEYMLRWEIRNNQPIELKAGISALCWRAKLNAFEGKIDEALDDLLSGYRIGSQMNCPESKAFEQHFARGMQSEVIKTFLIILNNGQIDAESLSDFDRQIKDLMARNMQCVNLSEEKMFAEYIVQRVFTDDGEGGGHLIAREAKKIARSIKPLRSGAAIFPSPAGGNALMQKIMDALSYIKYDYRDDFPNFYWMAVKGTDRKKTAEDLEKIYSFLDEVRRKKPYELVNAKIDLEKQVENMTNDYWAQLLAISWYWPRYFEIFYQHKCETSSFAAIIALMCFRADKGHFPDNLQELLDAGYIKKLPEDPYNEGSVTYKKVGDSFTLYSLGTNFADNGGEIVRDRYNGRIIWWDRQKRADAVFWPYPNERKERRLQRMGKIPVSDPNALIKEYGDPNKQSEK